MECLLMGAFAVKLTTPHIVCMVETGRVYLSSRNRCAVELHQVGSNKMEHFLTDDLDDDEWCRL